MPVADERAWWEVLALWFVVTKARVVARDRELRKENAHQHRQGGLTSGLSQVIGRQDDGRDNSTDRSSLA